MTRSLLLAALALFLASCGFHLRGALKLPEDVGTLHIVAKNKYSPLADELADSLVGSGIAATTDPATSPSATLNLAVEKWGDVPLSIDSRGRSQEYTLRYATVFDLRRADGSILVPRQVVELSRDYLSVPTQSAGTDSERDILVKEMTRDMVASIIRRIDVVSHATQPASQTIDDNDDSP